MGQRRAATCRLPPKALQMKPDPASGSPTRESQCNDPAEYGPVLGKGPGYFGAQSYFTSGLPYSHVGQAASRSRLTQTADTSRNVDVAPLTRPPSRGSICTARGVQGFGPKPDPMVSPQKPSKCCPLKASGVRCNCPQNLDGWVGSWHNLNVRTVHTPRTAHVTPRNPEIFGPRCVRTRRVRIRCVQVHA